MSERIKGLSIGLDLDTLRVERGLTGLKDRIRTVNSEMKANMSAFDRSEKSADKYRTRLDGLNKKLEVQKEVTKAAKEHYEEMVKEHGEGSKEAEKAAREYNNQAAALKNLERYVEGVTKEFQEFQRQQKIQNSTLFKAGDSLTKFGSGLKTISDKAKGMGKSLTQKITMPAVGAASALAGIALVKGFDRLVGIDNAKAKLKGLGHDAKGVEKIMDSALESVKGTSFGMDEAATTAANAVAAGIKPGKELTRYLSLTGDAAAIAGVNMGEMGSILNKVKTSNKAYNGELQQLADRGLPVYQWLAKEAGVAEDQVFDLAKNGKISSEMLMNAIEKNIGGAAKEIGKESFSAGIANMWAAVGRLGASFLDAGGKGGGFFSKLKPLVADFTDRIDSMGSYAEKAGEKFGEMFTGFIDKVKAVKSWFDNLSPSMQNIVKKGALIGTVVAVGIGPALVGLGTLGGVIANISTGLGAFLKFLAPATKGFSVFGGAAGKAGTSVGLLGKAFTVLTGPIGITIGIVAALAAGFVLLYKKSDSFREGVGKLVSTLKELGGKVLVGLKAGIGSVVSFFKEQGKVLQDFWKENGETIIKGASNIGNIVGAVFRGILKVIQFVMPAVFAIIKMVWDNIKGVIQGGLKVIMGLVQVFSGLFTGNFSKMWEGIKNIFFGALQFIWNFMQLMFWGRMLKGILSLGKLLINAFRGSWNGIKNIFSTVINWIVEFVKNRFTATRNTISNIFTAIRNLTKTAWDAIRGRIVEPVKSAVSSIRDRFTSMRKTITDIFTGIRDTVSKRVSSMVQTIKDMPGKMKDGLVKGADKLKEGMTTVARRMVDGLKRGVNGIITGINWVLGKLNVENKLGKWNPANAFAWYAHGTGQGGHPADGPAVVGDGQGSNAGRELVIEPDGKTYLSPAKPTLVNMKKGTHVIPAKMTRQLFSVPRYANGTLWGAMKSGFSKAVSAVKDWTGNVFDYIKNPGKLLNIALDKAGVELPNVGLVGDIAKGGFKYVKNKAVEYIKGLFDDFFTSAPSAGGGVQRWAGVAATALRMTGLYSKANLDRLLFQMQTESGGNPKAINLWDINAKRGTPSKGLMQVIDPTFRAYAMPGFDKNIWDPLSNILASIRYAVSRYGSLARAYRGVGYATGGLIKNAGLYALAENGWPEYVIPTDPKRRTDAMKLLALAGRDIGNKRPGQLPNPGGNDSFAEELLDAILDQNEILLAILKKDWTVEADGRTIAEVVGPYIERVLEAKRMRKARGRGYAT